MMLIVTTAPVLFLTKLVGVYKMGPEEREWEAEVAEMIDVTLYNLKHVSNPRLRTSSSALAGNHNCVNLMPQIYLCTGHSNNS
jgi:hypothetical protein